MMNTETKLIQKAVKLRIYPKKSDEVLMSKHFGSTRFIFNYFLDLRSKTYLEHKKSINYNQCSKLMTDLKKSPEFVWLNEVNAQSLQASIKDLDTAYDRFFRKITKFPRFKSKHDSNQSFKVPQRFKIDWETQTLKIPKFDTPFKFKGSYRGSLQKINSVTISRSASGKYYASVQGIFEIPVKVKTESNIGIDLGLKTLIVDSDGKEVQNPRFLKKALKKLKFLQRQHSKKKKGSKNRERSRKILARAHENVTNKRNNLLHQTTTKLIDENQVICVENLAVKNMIKNHCLAQSISDVSWGTLLLQLNYKASWHNRYISVIDRFFPSSKACSCCGSIKSDLNLSVRFWTCDHCGESHDRDYNAAKNILRQGMILMKSKSGLGTKLDSKQKHGKALELSKSMTHEAVSAVHLLAAEAYP